MISTVFSSSNPDGIDLDDTPIYYHYIGDDYGDHPPLGECPNESSSTTVGHFELSNYFLLQETIIIMPCRAIHIPTITVPHLTSISISVPVLICGIVIVKNHIPL